MKCKECGNEINLTVFGIPNDVCWGCLQEPEKKVALDKNIKTIDVWKSRKDKLK